MTRIENVPSGEKFLSALFFCVKQCKSMTDQHKLFSTLVEYMFLFIKYIIGSGQDVSFSGLLSTLI